MAELKYKTRGTCGKMLTGDEQAVYYAEAYKKVDMLCNGFPENEEYAKMKRSIMRSIRERKK